MDFIAEVVIPFVLVALGIVFTGALVFGAPLLVWGDYNVPAIKQHAAETWRQQGFEIIGYEGFQLTLIGRPGGCVWYTLRRQIESQTIYHGCVSKWGDEYHTYSTEAINAIRPH